MEEVGEAGKAEEESRERVKGVLGRLPQLCLVMYTFSACGGRGSGAGEREEKLHFVGFRPEELRKRLFDVFFPSRLRVVRYNILSVEHDSGKAANSRGKGPSVLQGETSPENCSSSPLSPSSFLQTALPALELLR